MLFRDWCIGAVLILILGHAECAHAADGASTTSVVVGAPNPLPAATSIEAQPAVADPLLVQVDEAIHVNSQRFLTANYHSPWQIFHGIVAYRKDFLLKVGDQKVSAIEWIATSEPKFDNQPLLMMSHQGPKFHPYTRPYAFEGHPSQSLALLSESHLPVDYQFRVNGKWVTLGDLLQTTMRDVNTREETTWVLWTLINYFKVDATWTNQWGQAWSIETLVQNEVAAHTPTRPCGGNHNLFALSRARDKYLKTGRPLRGVWMEADQKIKQYIEIARSMQNSDGSFSANFYKGPGFERDMNKRFNTTGHTMEFLAVGLPQERLNEPWVRNAVNVLSRELITHKKAAVDCGPLYHSLNALIIYRDRVRPPVAEQLADAGKPLTTLPTPAVQIPAPTAEVRAAVTPSGTPSPSTPVSETTKKTESDSGAPSAMSPENVPQSPPTPQGPSATPDPSPLSAAPAPQIPLTARKPPAAVAAAPEAPRTVTPVVVTSPTNAPAKLAAQSSDAKEISRSTLLDASVPRLPAAVAPAGTTGSEPASALRVLNGG
ncbi:MAG: hypothetical protein SFV23_18430 [Planctomycetaceae bacterium]|nr:hypothetical protein [Planctomycetaceae bacterium]